MPRADKFTPLECANTMSPMAHAAMQASEKMRERKTLRKRKRKKEKEKERESESLSTMPVGLGDRDTRIKPNTNEATSRLDKQCSYRLGITPTRTNTKSIS